MPTTVIDSETAAPSVEPASAAGPSVRCPHCRKDFVAAVDSAQPLRLQGTKCPHCKLFVPARVIAG